LKGPYGRRSISPVEVQREELMYLRALVVGLAVAAFATPALAQSKYPTRNIELIVPYGPGGSTDIVGRIVAQKLGERLGQNVVILNKPGASGTNGLLAAMRSTPDGYTLLNSYTAESVVVPQISPTHKYSILDEFEPIAVTGLVPVVLMVSKNMKANTLKEFIAEVQASPGKFTFGGGYGSPPHVMGAWMNKLRGLNVQHVPYRGGAQGINDVVGGHLNMFYGGVAAGKSAIDSGGVKPIAVTGDTRSSALPNVPTFKEGGVPEFDLVSWTVMLAPKGTPADVLAMLRKETAAVLDDPKAREMLSRQGVEKSDAKDVSAFLKQQREIYGRAVRELGIMMGNK
jgi:tripartite-type tricarboxylate transporter receptor subunit TctC